MPSFDIASAVDIQVLDNAINTVKKEVATRYDFRDTDVKVDLNKKDFIIALEVNTEMQMKQLIDILISRSMKQGIDGNAFDFSKDAYPSGKTIKKEVSVKNGLRQEDAKKIVKVIKDSKLKVQASIQGDAVRVTGAKRDDLQATMAMLRKEVKDLPLEFNNFRD